MPTQDSGQERNLWKLLEEGEREGRRADLGMQCYRTHVDAWHAGGGCIPSIRRSIWQGTDSVLAVTGFCWDADHPLCRACGSSYLSPTFQLHPHSFVVEVDGVLLPFKSVVAAYYALHRWGDPQLRHRLSKAFTKEEVEEAVAAAGGQEGLAPEGFDRYAAMLQALRCCYTQLPGAAGWLRSTSTAFLLCCDPSPVASSASFWTDGGGAGQNKMGLALMEIREALSCSSMPCPPSLCEARTSTSWPYGVHSDNWSSCVADLSFFCRDSFPDCFSNLC